MSEVSKPTTGPFMADVTKDLRIDEAADKAYAGAVDSAKKRAEEALARLEVVKGKGGKPIVRVKSDDPIEAGKALAGKRDHFAAPKRSLQNLTAGGKKADSTDLNQQTNLSKVPLRSFETPEGKYTVFAEKNLHGRTIRLVWVTEKIDGGMTRSYSEVRK